jgi:hypothetical protein
MNKLNDIKQRLLARRQQADTWIAQQRYNRLSPAAQREQHELARSPTGTGPTVRARVGYYHPDGWLMSELGNRYGNWTILVDLNNGRYTVTETGSRRIPYPHHPDFYLAVQTWSPPQTWTDRHGSYPMTGAESRSVIEGMINMRLESSSPDEEEFEKARNEPSEGPLSRSLDRYVTPSDPTGLTMIRGLNLTSGPLGPIDLFNDNTFINWPAQPTPPNPPGPLIIASHDFVFFGEGRYWCDGPGGVSVSDFERGLQGYVPNNFGGVSRRLIGDDDDPYPTKDKADRFAATPAAVRLNAYALDSCGVSTFDRVGRRGDKLDIAEHLDWIIEATNKCFALTNITVNWLDKPAPPNEPEPAGEGTP